MGKEHWELRWVKVDDDTDEIIGGYTYDGLLPPEARLDELEVRARGEDNTLIEVNRLRHDFEAHQVLVLDALQALREKVRASTKEGEQVVQQVIKDAFAGSVPNQAWEAHQARLRAGLQALREAWRGR